MSELRTYFSRLFFHSLAENNTNFKHANEYLIELLVSLARSCDIDISKPLVDYYAAALESEGSQRIKSFVSLGDVALLLSGCFLQRVESTGGLSYYVNMGSGAYQYVYKTSMNPLYNELSTRFTAAVAILNATASKTTINKEQSIGSLLALYDIHPTKSTWLKLAALGAAPIINATIHET